MSTKTPAPPPAAARNWHVEGLSERTSKGLVVGGWIVGHPRTSRLLFLSFALTVVVVVANGIERPANQAQPREQTQRQDIALSTRPVATPEQRVVDEMIGRYEIVIHGGTFNEICAQAGILKAAYLQAHDLDGYRNWGITEKYACNYVSGDGDLTVHQFTDQLKDKAMAYATVISELQKYVR